MTELSGSTPMPELLTLLLIEDDAGDAFLVEELLGQSDTPPKITWVRSMAECRARLTPDVQCVIVDLSLPDATGLEALEQVLDLAPYAAVLVLTGLDDAHVGAAAVAAGAQDYLVKQDVDARLLGRAVRYALERKRADLAQRRLMQAELTAQENARLEHGLLPVALLHTRDLEHHPRYLPGREAALLAGDFYDTVERPDGSVHLVVGDVCGHGPDEAALGVALRIAWRTLVLAGHEGNDLLHTLDRMLRHERKSAEIFTTLCTVVIDPRLDRARMHVVGHPAPLLVRDGTVEAVPGTPSGPPLGIFPDVEWTPIDVRLGEEWALLLYTDGLIEAMLGEDGELLGTEGLVHLVREQAAQGGIDLDRIVATVTEQRQHPLVDDIAAVLLRRRPR
ncbi:serine phosphatase RsbU (regulator of sigma subunit) [Thermocatellispora tengchongensis]|uniref:Serine phosphatase RsbU (Regulator of sigma subunit) n=1 Tax=Thermocatellispora tengchongensis TaxID=1073253 RepID=A0A840P975_9ACTN|nr:SpoIIE family protein phosphatase [Thermocatellispora tengchongensis]MBB5133990.1 serine phosphatase RsbU (regulator of sigma subunit) [Thermocatellispora tengchongensis]